MAASDEPEVDTLFVGLTRPAMAFGITYTYATIMVMITVIAFLGTGSLLGLLIGIPLYVVGYLACLHDPRVFDLYVKRMQNTPPTRTKRYWGCNTYRT